MAGRPASAAEVGRGASLRAVSNRYSRKEAEGAGAPPGYVSIQRADLYASSIEGSTWRMLGSVSAGQYVDNFYPDVSLSDTGLTDVAVEPARRRSNSRLRGQQAKRALETKGSQALEGPPATEVERRARARDGPRLSKNAQEANALGTAAVNQGDYERALQLFDEGLASAPGPDLKGVLLTNRSSTYAQALQFHNALRDAEDSIILEPTWSRGYQVKGAALVGLGRKAEAIQCFETAVELDPTDEEAKLNLQMERADIPADVRMYMQKVSGKGSRDNLQLTASSKAVSILNAMEDEGYGRRQLIIESISVENLPGDVFGFCKPFVKIRIGDREIQTRVLTKQGGDSLAGNLEKFGFEPGVSCDQSHCWNDAPLVLEFDKGVARHVTIRVMEAQRVGWDEETGVANVPLNVMSHSLKEHECTLLKDGQPVNGRNVLKHAQVRIMARVPAVADDGPVGIGLCFLKRGDDLIVDSLTANYARRQGVDPKHGDRVVSVDGVDVQGLTLAHVVALTMGPLGSSCRLGIEQGSKQERVEIMLERCALDVPQPDYHKTDAFSDEEQMALLMPSQRMPEDGDPVPSWPFGPHLAGTKEVPMEIQIMTQALHSAALHRARIRHLRKIYEPRIPSAGGTSERAVTSLDT